MTKSEKQDKECENDRAEKSSVLLFCEDAGTSCRACGYRVATGHPFIFAHLMTSFIFLW